MKQLNNFQRIYNNYMKFQKAMMQTDCLQKIRYELPIQKINRKRVRQSRTLVFTDANIYNFNKKQLRRTISNTQIEAFLMSKSSNQFIIHIKNQRDYRFCSQKRWEVYIEVINICIQFNLPKPKLYLIDTENLQQFTNRSTSKVDHRKLKLPQPLIFNEFDKINLIICKILQHDHSILYIGDKSIFQIRPDNFQEIGKLGKWTSLIMLKGDRKLFVKKIFKKFDMKISLSQARNQFMNYEQKTEKQKIQFIFQNPDEFIVITQFYNSTLTELIQNFTQLSENQIKIFFEKILNFILYQPINQISTDNILIKKQQNNQETIVFTQFQKYKPKKFMEDQFEINPEDYTTSNLVRLKLGVFLYKLTYGINPISSNPILRKDFFANNKIYYDQQRKKCISNQLNDLINKLLNGCEETNLIKSIKNANNNLKLVTNILKHAWFMKK